MGRPWSFDGDGDLLPISGGLHPGDESEAPAVDGHPRDRTMPLASVNSPQYVQYVNDHDKT